MADPRPSVARPVRRIGRLTVPQLVFLVTGLALAAAVFGFVMSLRDQSTPAPGPTVQPAPIIVVESTATPVPPSATAIPVPSNTATAVPPSPTRPAPTATPVPTAVPTLAPSATPSPLPAVATTFARRPLIVMVENHPDARPQSGLDLADVVYEAVAEWGITRFMAVFATDDAPVLGPIRSARHYFIHWAEEYNALVTFAGASPQGYAALRGSALATIDYTYGEGQFWRSRAREAPHNLYADTAELRASARGADGDGGRLAGLTFKAQAAPVREVSRVAVVYPDGYTIRYAYQPETNRWARSMVGRPHVDGESGQQYRPRNVIVQVVDTWPIRGDNAGRVDMETTGEGTAYVFSDGQVVKGIWRKASLEAPTRFLDTNGKPIDLVAGQTWIQVLPDDGDVSYE